MRAATAERAARSGGAHHDKHGRVLGGRGDDDLWGGAGRGGAGRGGAGGRVSWRHARGERASATARRRECSGRPPAQPPTFLAPPSRRAEASSPALRAPRRFTLHPLRQARRVGPRLAFLAPPLRCADALSTVVYTPVDSHTYSAPVSPHGISPASLRHDTQGRRGSGDRECGQQRLSPHGRGGHAEVGAAGASAESLGLQAAAEWPGARSGAHPRAAPPQQHASACRAPAMARAQALSKREGPAAGSRPHDRRHSQLGVHRDALAVDVEAGVVAADVVREAAVHRVVLEHVGHVLCAWADQRVRSSRGALN